MSPFLMRGLSFLTHSGSSNSCLSLSALLVWPLESRRSATRYTTSSRNGEILGINFSRLDLLL